MTVGSLLKALGLTIWGLIAFGLLALFIFVGYEAALKYRSSEATPEKTTSSVRQSAAESQTPFGDGAAVKPAPPGGDSTTAPTLPLANVTHQMLQNAAAQHRHALVIEYGQELLDSGTANADDMVSVAQSYSSIEDCANARAWMEKANTAFRAIGQEPSETQRQVILNCHDKPRVMFDPAQEERARRLLQSLHDRAEADRKRLPQLELEAESATSGNPSVILGELYYGFSNYGKAIEWIRKGLARGGVVHLDDAYVYLGQSEQAEGNIDEARKAFNQLKDVPGISPRVLRLWTLYADVELRANQ